MKILSIDVGMKCLAYCVLNVIYDPLKESNDYEYNIIKWGILDLCGNKKHDCCGKTKKNRKCEKNPKYYKNSQYFCKIHAKSQSYKIPANELKAAHIKKLKLIELKELYTRYNISNGGLTKKLKKTEYQDIILKEIDKSYLNFVPTIKTNSINLATYGYRLKVGFEELFKDYNIDRVIIENQIGPLALRMKTLQGMIMQHFIEKNCAVIEEISAANKLKEYIPKKKKTKYAERKKLGILITKKKLNDSIFLHKWLPTFLEHKKKDDLADSFLQGLWYIKHNNLVNAT